MRRYLLFTLFLCMHCIARGQTGYKYRYWFDNDNTNAQTGYSLSKHWQFMADLNGLSESFHTIHVQVADSTGTMSVPLTRFFLNTTNTNIEEVYYWFDNDTDAQLINIGTQSVFDIDVSHLSEGFHKLYVQLRGNTPSSTVCHFFVKIPQTEGVGFLTCLCYVDNNLFRQEQLPSEGGIIKWNFDVSDIPQGFHRMQVQVITPSGAATSTYDAFFLRTTMAEEMNDMKCVYCIDGAEFHTEAGKMTNGSFHCDLDVSTLSDGPHRLSYYLTNGKGVSTRVITQFFVKIPVGGNGVIRYEYWLNSNDDQKHVVSLPERTTLLSIISLLPIESQPIRSSNFKFAIKNMQPVIYARNDFHIRFTDVTGRFVDANEEYVDEQVSAAVMPVGKLQATQTFPKVGENDVRWYTMQSAPGDTAAFKLSQPATVQLFAPSGTEVFKSSEAASVKWGGIHTWEEGTYYLAVHDVTGSKDNMTLEYMHMDKYDVVDWDVHRVGNGGCSTITFKGNGFRDLYAVDLVIAPGDTVHSVAVSHDSDAETAVTFDFTNVTLGDYNAVFHFTEEDKPVANVVTVEEAVDIELATDVSFPSSFLRGTSTTYTIKITNKGNMTAYDVPLEIRLSSESFSNIESVNFKDIDGNDMDVFSLYFNEEDSISAEDRQYFMNNVQSLSGLSTFIILRDTIRNVDVGFSDRLITIPPKYIFTIKVEVKCTSSINLYATIPSDWYAVYTKGETSISQLKKRASEKDLCCEKEKWECIVSNASDALGLIPAPLLGCIPAIVDLGTFTTFEIMCGKGKSTKDNIKNYFANYFNNKNGNRGSAWGKVVGFVLGCFGAKIIGVIEKLRSNLKSLNLNKKITLQQADNYAKIRNELIDEYDRMMRLADQYFKQGNIAKAEEIEKEAQKLLNQADDYKMWADIKRYEASEIATEIKIVENQIEQEKENFDRIISYFKNGYNFLAGKLTCAKERLDAKKNCPRNPNGGGGTSSPQPPSDPNDIYGYLSEAGSKFIADSVARVNYTIEFENDTTFATAAAHTIVIKDTLDNKVFDLTKFMPTGIRIGSREAFLDAADVVTKNNVTSFVKTIDMRPEINAIAQVDGEYNQKKGIAEWRFTSLDPMTMEPTNDLMQGILPVNYDGTSGIGEVMFEIGVKQGKADGTQIKNRAGIVFDYEEAILTPTWTNIVDAVPPTSRIDNSWMVNDSTLRVTADAFDARSGVWKYTWYVQANENAPWWKEGETESPQFDYHIFEGIDYGFCVLATDSAGNVEQKVIQRERGFKTYGEEFDEAVGLSPLPASPDGEEKAIYDLSGRRQAVPKENQVNIIDKKKVLIR